MANFLYFVFIGWWLGLLVSLAGYLLCLSVIGIPLGTILLNRLPGIMYLKTEGVPCAQCAPDRHYHEELPFLLRVLWFFIIGWTLGFLAISVGYVLLVTIIGIPLGVFVLNRVPLLLTLSRRYA